jgi:asparagine synthase (glutamine-hydrolysing)
VCGIVGRFSWDGPVDPEGVLPGLVNHLVHRGPDEGAFWEDARFFLGHRRLSIIDLAQGGQPMASPDGSLVVTFNGEIYNYVELRDELRQRGYAFRTSSDTEVLLHGYREWGVELPARLVGMFAFAIADRRRGELFLARDRFGEKPLLYLEHAGAVTFASELRPLAALPGLDRRLNEPVLGAYLCLNYVPGNDTLLAGVHRLPPGTWRLYTGRGSRSGEYWAPPPDGERPGLSLDAAVEELRHQIDGAVGWALRSDVPVGIFLSGGMDSSLVAESASRQGRLSRAYCLDFPEDGYSEWGKASFVADRLGVPLTRVVLDASSTADFLRVVEHADDPLADSSALAVWTISREAAQHNKVVLGGDGGDELFAGYLTYQATLLHAATVARLPGGVRRALAARAERLPTSEKKVSLSYQMMRFFRASDLPPGEAHFTWNGVWLPSGAARLLRPGAARAEARGALAALAARHAVPERPGLGALQRADMSEYLPNDILAKVDRMSMAHGLEVRAPFLQPAMAEFALSLPAALRCRMTGRPKRILRELARRLYGERVSGAKKQGFSIPIHGWVRGPARNVALDLLSAESVRRIDALDADAVERVVADHMAGRRSLGWEVWGLMVLAAWHRSRILTPPRPLSDTSDLVRREVPLREASVA